MACKLPFGRLYDMVAVGAEHGDIADGRRMSHHVEIHCRSYKYRGLGRQVCSDQHVVSDTIGHLAYGRGSGRSYHHGISPQTEIHMAVPLAGVGSEELRYHRFARQSGECDRRDELASGRSHDNLHLGTLLDKQTHQ